MFLENYDAVFRVAVCRIFSLPSPRIISTHRSLVLVTFTILRFKLCGAHSSRRLMACRMTRRPLHLLTTSLDAA
jgi:hypothetical protein